MQITETHSQGLKHEFEVTVSAQEIEEKLNKHLESISKKVKIPGFRPGKIPLPVLRQRYKTDALSDALEELVQNGTDQIIKENKLKPALKPKVNFKTFEEGKDLTFEVKMEVLPSIGEIKLDGFSFEKHVVGIPSETVSKVLENFAKRHRKTYPIQKPRKTKRGDIVIIDFEGFIENEPIEGGSGKNHALELGSATFIPGFEDQLVDQEKGAFVKVKVTFPTNYHEERYANKPARFDVTIHDIHEAEPVAIDIELAKKFGFESLESMKKEIEKNISKDYTAQSFLSTKRHVLDALAERFSFEVPKSMVELEFKNIWEQLCHELGLNQSEAANTNGSKTREKTFEEATGKKEEDLKREYETIAERRVRLGILLAEIGNRENIAVTNQELMNALTARAREFPGKEKEVFDFYRKNESAMASLKAPLFENKVVEFILSQAKVTEKPITPEDLEKLLAHEEQEAEKKISSEAKKLKKTSKKKDA